MKTPKKSFIIFGPILGSFQPRPRFLEKGGHALTCGSAFFSRYQFEILTHYSLSKNIPKKKKKKKKLKKKMGCGDSGQSRLAKKRFNSPFFRLLTDFSK